MKKIDLNPNFQVENLDNSVIDDETPMAHNRDLPNEKIEQNNFRKYFDEMIKKPKIFAILTLVAVLAGVGTGFGTFKLSAESGLTKEPLEAVPTSTIKAGDTFGSSDDVFDSNALGYLDEGGLNGEGTHRLLRPGGETQTVYLTSSVTDLNEFVGMDVKIWGETFKGQKAGWFMDVGRVEVIKVEGESPIRD
jgi:hypothetical protein